MKFWKCGKKLDQRKHGWARNKETAPAKIPLEPNTNQGMFFLQILVAEET